MFPINQNFLSANAGLSNGNSVIFPMYLNTAPTSSTIYAPYGIARPGQIAIVIGTGAWILISIVNHAGVWTASWEQFVSSTGDVLSVTGTANQILATPTTGNVVLSLIGPYTPSTYTLDGVLYGNGTSSIGATAAGTTGQVLTANTGAAPTWTTATFPSTAGAAGTILRSNGTNWVASTDTYPDTATAGALIAATATNVIGQIADVAVGQVLASGGVGVIPAYTATPSVTSIATVTGLSASTSGAGITLNTPTNTGVASGPVILNARAGQVVFTSVSIAAAADLTLTITNSAITGSSTQVICDISGATTGSAISVKSKTPSAGSLALVITNGTGATTTTSDITVTFLVLN